MINAYYYDIESLNNIFSVANFKDLENEVDIYVLSDNPSLISQPGFIQRMEERIKQKNHNFNGTVRFFDLSTLEANKHLAKTFGLCNYKYINDPNGKNNKVMSIAGKTEPPYPDEFRLVCDTDPEYIQNPDKYPYLMGYNSYNYDTTMLAVYLSTTFIVISQSKNKNDNGKPTRSVKFNPQKASIMRDVNNDLFTSTYKERMPSYLTRDGGFNSTENIVRKNMLMSGRHIDVAKLNEKQSKVGLKRLLGMLGWQILESDKLHSGQDTIENEDQLLDLIAYNVSDVVNLKNLFYHPLYQAQFELKKQLLHTYPELVYEQTTEMETVNGKRQQSYKPNISQQTVRPDRLNIDSSSAQFATKCLCPYNQLKDIETVSYMYPAPEQCKPGQKPRNILTECIEFLDSRFPKSDPKFAHIWESFNNVVAFYRSIEGQNFNNTPKYRTDYPNGPQAITFADIRKLPTCIPYYDKNGNPTSAFALFSTGGIHGAEYNKELYESDLEKYQAQVDDMEYVQSVYPNPVDLREAKTVTMPDGRELPYTVFLKSGLKKAESQYRNISEKKPVLFKKSKKANDDSTTLNPKYVFTSASVSNHEDFSSYYPNLLRNMRAFYNPGLGKDRYGEIYEQKQTYGKYMKDKSKPQEERNRWRILREGTKLILNSASGAGDATFDNNIRVNNQIISMRIIGQLFSWRIGQAQTYEGAKIISTNTDGLYSVMEEEENNKILARESANIGVDIEPEPLYLISKDTNNRIELDANCNIITGASGGTLSCRLGPVPEKSLAHPAIIDWALAEYLVIAAQHYKNTGIDKRFDREIGMNILRSAKHKFEPVKYLIMFQNIIASSPGSYTFICGYNDGDDQKGEQIVLQHYNRSFIMKDNTPNTIHLQAAAARIITPAVRNRRNREGLTTTSQEMTAVDVLKANGVTPDEISDRDVIFKKITNIDPSWFILICNESLWDMDPNKHQWITENLDFDKYLILLEQAFENSWMNHLPSNGDDDFEPAEATEESADD